MVKRLIVVLGLGFGVVLGLPSQGLAQTVRAYLSQTEVLLNRQFVLNVEISGTQQLDEDPPVLPDLSAFAVYLGSSTSTSMQIVNSRTSLSLTFQHRFQATAEGTFEIGPVTVLFGKGGGKYPDGNSLLVRGDDETITIKLRKLPLAVHHVTVEDRTVRGTLVRYDDPAWGLPLETEFRGTLSDDGRLEGWFRSVGTRIDTIPEVGHWWALRAADAPLAL